MSSKSRFLGTVGSVVAVMALVAAWRWARRRNDLTGRLIHDLGDMRLPSMRAFGDDCFDCGCPDVYFCPIAGEVECPRHSGFSGCCARPADHVLLRTLPQDEDIVDGSPEHDWVDLVVGRTDFPRRWRPLVPARRARVTAQTYRGRVVTLELDVIGRARGSLLIAQPRDHGWPTWHTWIEADQAVLEPRHGSRVPGPWRLDR